MKIGLGLLVVSLVLIGFEKSISGLMFGAVVYGVAQGILSPALNAWTVDMSLPNHRGKAMATMYISLEAGIGLGALFSGWVYQDALKMIPPIMYASAVITVFALIYLLFRSNTPVGHEENVAEVTP